MPHSTSFFWLHSRLSSSWQLLQALLTPYSMLSLGYMNLKTWLLTVWGDLLVCFPVLGI